MNNMQSADGASDSSLESTGGDLEHARFNQQGGKWTGLHRVKRQTTPMNPHNDT